MHHTNDFNEILSDFFNKNLPIKFFLNDGTEMCIVITGS